MIEDVAKLHLELVALAFACNFNRVATLQHGDGTDATKYAVPSNAGARLALSSHQPPRAIGFVGGHEPIAEDAHAEIDVVRMQTLLHGLDQFKDRGLFDKSVILWTNHIADGPDSQLQERGLRSSPVRRGRLLEARRLCGRRGRDEQSIVQYPDRCGGSR